MTGQETSLESAALDEYTGMVREYQRMAQAGEFSKPEAKRQAEAKLVEAAKRAQSAGVPLVKIVELCCELAKVRLPRGIVRMIADGMAQAGPNVVYEKHEDGPSSLHLVVCRLPDLGLARVLEYVKAAANAGATRNLQNRRGRTVLHYVLNFCQPTRFRHMPTADADTLCSDALVLGKALAQLGWTDDVTEEQGRVPSFTMSFGYKKDWTTWYDEHILGKKSTGNRQNKKRAPAPPPAPSSSSSSSPSSHPKKKTKKQKPQSKPIPVSRSTRKHDGSVLLRAPAGWEKKVPTYAKTWRLHNGDQKITWNVICGDDDWESDGNVQGCGQAVGPNDLRCHFCCLSFHAGCVDLQMKNITGPWFCNACKKEFNEVVDGMSKTKGKGKGRKK